MPTLHFTPPLLTFVQPHLLVGGEPWQYAAIALICLLSGWWLYGRKIGIQKQSTGGGLRISGRLALALLRMFSIGTLAFLLLKPLVRTVEIDQENPVAVLLMDESASVLRNADSTQMLETLRAWPGELEKQLLAEGIHLESFGFAGDIKPRNAQTWSESTWDGEQTNLDAAVQEINSRFEHRNIAALILASDGLSNRGSNPEYMTSWPKARLFTVGLGDTLAIRDRWIDRVDHNRVAYLGNTFPLEAVIQAQDMSGEEAIIEIFHGNDRLEKTSWTPSSDNASKRLEFILPADKIGNQRFEIRCSIGDREANPQNNAVTFYVEILESKRQVLCITAAPHPDVNSILLALQANEQTEVEVVHLSLLKSASELLVSIQNADVILAHNILGQTFGGLDWTSIMEMNTQPVWWILGNVETQDALQFHRQWGIQIEQSTGITEAHQSRLNPTFALFDFPLGLENAIRQWPPIQGPFGNIAWSAAWTPLLYRQLGALETEQAFWAVRTDASTRRMAVSFGQGFWSWRMRSFLKEGNHDLFNAIIQKQVQFLGSQENLDRFRVNAPKRIESDQRLVFTGEVYDATMTPVEAANMTLELEAQDGDVYSYSFLRRGNRYAIDAGRLPAGRYTWTAKCTLDQEIFNAKGACIVEALRAEMSSKAADHDILIRLAEKTGGSFCGGFDNETSERIIAAMKANGWPAPIMHEQVDLDDLIQWRFILWLLIGWLTCEWIIRRRTLGY